MLKDLIANAAIIISFLYMAGELIKKVKLHSRFQRYKSILSGIAGGILGIILMAYGVSVNHNVVIDLRFFALIVIAMHGGFISTMIAGIVMSAFRILYFGFHFGSILGASIVLFMSLVCGIIAKLKISEYKKWLFMNTVSIFTVSIYFIITLANAGLIRDTLLYFLPISIIMAFMVTYISKHIEFTNNLYQKYKMESMKDFLTGLDNVRRFDKLMNHISNSITEGQMLALMMLDIDYFKKINDTYGHSTGDDVLRELSKLISDTCKNADSTSRIGGEEFCVILRNQSTSKVLKLAEQIRGLVEKRSFTSHNIKMTISIGIAVYPETVNSLEHLIEEADKALYYSKRNGRNKVSINS